MPVPRPVYRSKLRRLLGQNFYILKWHCTERFSGKQFTKAPATEKLTQTVFEHQSLLLRPLRGVAMSLQHNKVTNLCIATRTMSGVVIEPGETFSLWRHVGKPTIARGYLEGLELQNGTLTTGVGGGLCQLGNLLYWMFLHTPLQVTERWRHGYDVFPDINRVIPFGCGATLAYNYIDLQVYNPTKQRFQINLWLDEKYLQGSITSDTEPGNAYSIFETDHKMELQRWGGYTRHNKIWREVTNKVSKEITRELITENHAIMMYEPMLPASAKSTSVFKATNPKD
jgi:vancomycin resistance protein VanW